MCRPHRHTRAQHWLQSSDCAAQLGVPRDQTSGPLPRTRGGPPRTSPHLSLERSICLVLNLLPGTKFHSAAAFHIARSLSGNLGWTDFPESVLCQVKQFTYTLSQVSLTTDLQGWEGRTRPISPGNGGSGAWAESVPHRDQLPRVRARM